MTYREAVFPNSETVPDLPIPKKWAACHEPYPADLPPVFIGHYWLPAGAERKAVAPNIACLDYSVAKGGRLTAYRWSGEQRLRAEKFITEGGSQGL